MTDMTSMYSHGGSRIFPFERRTTSIVPPPLGNRDVRINGQRVTSAHLNSRLAGIEDTEEYLPDSSEEDSIHPYALDTEDMEYHSDFEATMEDHPSDHLSDY